MWKQQCHTIVCSAEESEDFSFEDELPAIADNEHWGKRVLYRSLWVKQNNSVTLLHNTSTTQHDSLQSETLSP